MDQANYIAVEWEDEIQFLVILSPTQTKEKAMEQMKECEDLIISYPSDKDDASLIFLSNVCRLRLAMEELFYSCVDPYDFKNVYQMKS